MGKHDRLMPIRSRRCACGTQYDVLDWRGELCGLDDQVDDAAVCPQCGGEEFEKLILGAHGIDLGDVGGVGKTYPYYDRSLRCEVNSAAHRRQLCRERNLEPVDGDWDPSEESRAQERESEARKERLRVLYDRYDNDPAFRGYREARDKGLMP